MPVSISYSTVNGSAVAPGDFVAANNNFASIPPGQTVGTIDIPIVGDINPESTETFTLNLVNVSNADATSTTAIGTIQDDDGIAGQVHHFRLSSIPSPQLQGRPFAASVQAEDYLNALVTSYSGTPSLTAADAGSPNAFNILGDVTHSQNFSGFYTLGYSFTPDVDITVVAFRHYAGTKVTLWTDDGQVLASQNVSSVNGMFTVTPLASAVKLTAGVRYRLAYFTGGSGYYYRFDLPPTFAHGTINQSYQGSGDTFPNFSDGVRWWFVDVVYNIGAPIETTPAQLSGFVNGVWTGNVAVDGAGSDVRLFVNDSNGHIAESQSFEVRPDCNANAVDDATDLANHTSQDVVGEGASADGIPDECQQDLNGNHIPDDIDIANGTSQDCNANGVPDEVDIAQATSLDCNNNGIPDECDLAYSVFGGVEQFSDRIYSVNALDGSATFLRSVSGVSGFMGLGRDPQTGLTYSLATIFGQPSLVRLDISAGTYSFVGAPDVLMDDIAFRADGVLYGIGGNNNDFENQGTLFILDKDSGAATSTGIQLSQGSGHSIAFSGDNEILLHATNGDIERVNVTTGESAFFMSTGLPQINAMAYDPFNNRLLAETFGNLFSIDLSSPNLTYLGFSGVTFTGLSFIGASLDLNQNGIPDECENP